VIVVCTNVIDTRNGGAEIRSLSWRWQQRSEM